MKGAVLISGAYRNATEPIVNLLRWLRSQEGYEIDVYLHFWWHESYVGKRYRHDHLGIVEKDPTQEILERIHPKKWKMEEQCKVDLKGLPYRTEFGGSAVQRESLYFAVLSQMESLKRCWQLVENPNQYDFIMRLRGDLFVTDESYRISLTKGDLDENKVFIADGKFFTGWPYGDWAYLARPKVMELFILHQETIFRHLCKELGYFPHIHNFMVQIFRLMGVDPIRWDAPLKITRLSETHSKHLCMDPEGSELGKEPFYWQYIDQERLTVPV